MIEQKIKEHLEKYFSNISNWETEYFSNSCGRWLNLIKFSFTEKVKFDELVLNTILKKLRLLYYIHESCYMTDPIIQKYDNIIQITINRKPKLFKCQ